nr:2-oxo acid dehydrogenase subunit E2 [Kribbella shirazensis]
MLPGFVRVALLGSLHRLPHRQRALAGTVGVTAVGMFGAGGGWGIGFQLHTLSIVVGGVARRPIFFQGVLVEREFLQLTVSLDHDVVDGAPAARFVGRLRELITSGDGIRPAVSWMKPA